MQQAVNHLLTHTYNLFFRARKAGLTITHSREIDVMRSLVGIDFTNVGDYKITLRTNLVSSREEEIIFERVFQTYWGSTESSYDGDYILARSELLRNDLETGRSNEGHRDMFSETTTSGDEEVTRRSNLATRWDPDAPPLYKSINELAKRLATKESRRETPFSKGRKLDMGKTIRRSIRDGLEISKLIRRRKKIQKTRIVLLCDVSGSMDVFNAFLLQLMFGIQKQLKNSKTYVFSTKLTDVSHQSVIRTTPHLFPDF